MANYVVIEGTSPERIQSTLCIGHFRSKFLYVLSPSVSFSSYANFKKNLFEVALRNEPFLNEEDRSRASKKTKAKLTQIWRSAILYHQPLNAEQNFGKVSLHYLFVSHIDRQNNYDCFFKFLKHRNFHLFSYKKFHLWAKFATCEASCARTFHPS